VARTDASLDISRALKTSIRGLPIEWKRLPDALATRGYVPWEQISSLIIMVSTRLGDAPRIENTGSTSWKPLRSSSGHALDDDDDVYSYSQKETISELRVVACHM